MQQRKTDARPIWLVGMMGCGKSTVGPLLAHRIGRDFLDNDALIQERAGRTIPEIFDAEGEIGFRVLEAEAIGAAAQGSAVVALGGGAIAQSGAAERLAALGTVVYLRASSDTLLERVGHARGRPLLDGLEPGELRRRLVAMLSERESAYETAEIVVDTDRHGPQAVAERIAQKLEASVGEPE